MDIWGPDTLGWVKLCNDWVPSSTGRVAIQTVNSLCTAATLALPSRAPPNACERRCSTFGYCTPMYNGGVPHQDSSASCGTVWGLLWGSYVCVSGLDHVRVWVCVSAWVFSSCCNTGCWSYKVLPAIALVCKEACLSLHKSFLCEKCYNIYVYVCVYSIIHIH